VDVQELPQKLNFSERIAVNPLADCPSASVSNPGCTVADCRWRCALEVIDEMLGAPRSAVSGEEVDLLLDLRWQLRQRAEAEAALKLFCDLRRRMEARHYLAFFRVRRWMENHLVAAVRVCPAAEVHEVPVKLDHYCVEAIRRVCLCASMGYGAVMLAPRLQFNFRPLGAPVARTVAAFV
jgi:hypothetical protein